MQKTNYQQPTTVVMVTDYDGILCVSGTGQNDLGGYWNDVTPAYGEDD